MLEDVDQSVPRRLLPRPAGRRVPDRALLPAVALQAAAGDPIQPELFDRLVLADYTFQKNRIFAYLNLSDDELMLFDKLYLLLEPQVPMPDLVLYLTADVATCMERIRSAADGSSSKQSAEEYMAELIDAYNHYYYHYDAPRSSSSTPATSTSPAAPETSTSWCG